MTHVHIHCLPVCVTPCEIDDGFVFCKLANFDKSRQLLNIKKLATCHLPEK